MFAFWREDFTLTKRHMGIIVFAAGLLALIGLLSIDPLTALLHRMGSDMLPPDRQVGIGPKQQLAIIASWLLTVLGLTMIPLGANIPAQDQRERQSISLPAWWGTLAKVLLWIVIGVLVFYLIVYAVYAVNIIRFPFDYDQGEGFELVDTVMFSQFQWPYQDTETYPFYSSNYPPLFHILAVPFVWLFGPAYWYGRLLAFLGTLITAGAIGYAVFRAEKHRWIAVISGLAYLASNYIYHIGPLFRQHLFMVMLETLAIIVLVDVHRIEDKRVRRRRLIIGLGLILAAGFTKQHAIFTAIAAFVYLFIYNPRRCLTWGVMFSIIGGITFFGIDAATGGQWWLNIITANVNPFVPGQFSGLFSQWIGLHGVLLIMAGLVIVYELYFDAISLYAIWFGVAGLSTILAGKWGAGDSYFASAIAAACILSGIFAARVLRSSWRWPDNYITRLAKPLVAVLADSRRWVIGLGAILVPVLYLLYAVAVFHMPTEGVVFSTIADTFNIEPNTDFGLYDSAGWTVGYAVIGQIPTEEDYANGWTLVDIVAEGDTAAISEDAAFSLLAGKDVVGNPTQLRNLYNNNLYDSTELNAMIENQAFHALILRALFYPDPVLYTMMEAYEQEQSIPMNGFDYQVFRPDPDWPARQNLRDAIHAANFGDEYAVVPPVDGLEPWLDMIFAQAEWAVDDVWADGEVVYRYAEEGETIRVVIEQNGDETSLVRFVAD